MSPNVHSAVSKTLTMAVSSSRSQTIVVLASKHVLWLFAWLLAAFFAMIWIIMPDKNGEIFYDKIYHHFETNKQWGSPGSYILLFTGPIVVLAVVACAILELEKAFPSKRSIRKGRSGWLRRVYDGLWTQPLVIKGPMGMMTAVEILAFAMVMFVTLWHFFKYTLDYFKVIDAGESAPEDPTMTIKMQKFEYIALMFGWVALVPLALLFLPVSRGSPILKLIDIPFEHAVKYHVWLGHLTMLLLLAHGAIYLAFYIVREEAYLYVKWHHNGIANLPGVIALAAGLLMWPTSLAWVRRRHFNLFFNVHQLYLVFFAFAAWHLGVLLTGYFLGGPFLFFIDRFLRFLQSRRAVRGAKARVLPTGIVEVKLPVSSYTPISFVFLRVGDVAKLQWHPFSTSSSPLDATNYMSVLIKPLGDWTNTLRDSVDTSKGSRHCPFKIFAEGPYGHESNYYLKYENLLLVAGGIGITPFIAIITDVLLRYQQGESGLPMTVDLIWCVRRRAELGAFRELLYELSRLQTQSLQLNIRVFLTGDRGPATVSSVLAVLEGPDMSPDDVAIELYDQSMINTRTSTSGGERGEVHENDAGSTAYPGFDRGGSGSNLWLLAGVTCAASLGLTLLLAFFRVYVYHPHSNIDPETGEGPELAGWIDVLLFLVSLVLGIVGFGGTVVLGSSLASKRFKQTNSASHHSTVGNGKELDSVVSKVDSPNTNGTSGINGDISPAPFIKESILGHSKVVLGTRPDFMEVMDELRVRHNSAGGAEVGVMVCGPETLAETVAEQCRSQNFKQLMSSKGSTTQFHYHSVSFDL